MKSSPTCSSAPPRCGQSGARTLTWSRAAQLATLYAHLHDALIEHLDAEEQHVMPLVEACITHKEWAKIGKAAQRGTPLKDGPRLLGMLAYDGDPDVIAQMLGAVPAPDARHGRQDRTARIRQARHPGVRHAHSLIASALSR